MIAIRKYGFVFSLVAGLIGCCSTHAQVISSFGETPATNAAARRPVISSTTGTTYYGNQEEASDASPSDASPSDASPSDVAADSTYQPAGDGTTYYGCDSYGATSCGSCPTACGGGCGAGCDGCGIGGDYFGCNLLKRSDHCFGDFISPMTNPVFFEDPRNLTEVRFIFLNHEVPSDAGGGHVRLYALQLRAKLAENLSLIATKDGYINSTNPLIGDGWADISLGLKFNLWKDACCGRMLSTGITYIAPWGSTNSLQGNGDGEFNLFASGGSRLGSRSHWLSAAGWRLPVDTQAASTSLYWSNHFDVQVSQRAYLLTEVNWYHWSNSGTGGIAGVEGLDLFNLGSEGVTGNDIITGAVGGKFKPSQHTEIGLAYEVPITDRRDIIQNRLTFDLILRY
ncbi:MAG: hypothetical protein ACR2NP_03090 [Pirellulaceae bacterium]